MMSRFFVIAILMLWAADACAQRRITVIDMDTSLPIRDVSVRVDSGLAKQTDALGRVDLPVVFDSVTFTHVRYEREHLALAEVSDTMYLLPVEHMLPEVKVNAASPELLAMFKGWAMAGAMMGTPDQGNGIVVTFDFASMLDRRGRRDKKHLERAKKILKEWDEKPVNTSP